METKEKIASIWSKLKQIHDLHEEILQLLIGQGDIVCYKNDYGDSFNRRIDVYEADRKLMEVAIRGGSDDWTVVLATEDEAKEYDAMIVPIVVKSLEDRIARIKRDGRI